jgi:hypothetical protein
MFEIGEGRTDQVASPKDATEHVADRPGERAGQRPADLSVAVGALRRAAEVLVRLDWACQDEASVPDSLVSLARVWRVVEASVAHGMATMSRAAVTERAGGLPAANWWAHQSLGHGGQGAWLERAGELIDRFPSLGAAVRRGDLSLDHLRVLDEIRDGAVLAELTELDGELCRVAERASMINWRREVRRRVDRIRVQLADRQDADRGDADEMTSGSHGPPAHGDDPAEESPQEPSAGGDSLFDGLDDDSGIAEAAAGAERRDDLPGDGSCTGAGDPPEEDGWLTMRTTASGGLLVRGEL